MRNDVSISATVKKMARQGVGLIECLYEFLMCLTFVVDNVTVYLNSFNLFAILNEPLALQYCVRLATKTQNRV